MKKTLFWILHGTVFAIIAVLFALQHIELSAEYEKGIAYAEAGDYQKAYEQMRSIAEYRDAPDKAENYGLELDYQALTLLIEEKNWDLALEKTDAILSVKSYKDTEDKKNLCLYEQAKAYAFDGDLHNAELIFMRLPMGFMDVMQRREIISTHKKFAGKWRCSDNNLDLTTVVYTDDDGIPRIRAVISDRDGLLLDEPITLNGEGMEIFTDRFSWAIYGNDSFSFVYTNNSYTVMKQPVVEGTKKYIFEKVKGTDYDSLNAQYTTTEF